MRANRSHHLLIESLFIAATILVVGVILAANAYRLRSGDSAATRESQKAALSHERGREASKIKDIHERQKYIAAQGDEEAERGDGSD